MQSRQLKNPRVIMTDTEIPTSRAQLPGTLLHIQSGASEGCYILRYNITTKSRSWEPFCGTGPTIG